MGVFMNPHSDKADNQQGSDEITPLPTSVGSTVVPLPSPGSETYPFVTSPSGERETTTQHARDD